MQDFGFLNDKEETTEKLEIEKKQLRPYKKVHYLISVDLDQNDKILEILDNLEMIEGIEIDSTCN